MTFISDLNGAEIDGASADDKANLASSKTETTTSNTLVNGAVADSDTITVTASLKSYHEKNKESIDIPSTKALIQKKTIEYVEESEEDFVEEDTFVDSRTKRLQCQQCIKTFKDSRGLKNHISSVHL